MSKHGKGYFFLLGFAFVAAFVLPGCGSIAKEYVSADRATYEAIAPEYREYVNEDDELTEDQKKLRLANVDSWDYRVTQAEEAGDE